MASVEQMAQQLQECMQEIARLRLSLQPQQQPQQAPPIVVHASPSAADIANEFTKVGKLDHFEGDEAKWSEWDFNLLGYVGGFSPALEQAMRNAKQSRHVIPIPTVDSDRHLSQRLFAMLSRLLTKRAHKLLRGCESNNGLEAYRQLCLNYGSETDEKGTTGLMFEIISFKFGSEIGEVADLLTEFKLKIKQHDEAPSTEPVPDAVIKTVLVNNVPEPLGSKTGTILGSQRAVNVPIPSTKIVG